VRPPPTGPQAEISGHALSAVLQRLAQQTDRDRISVRDLLAALGDRALGALLFVFAFPNVFPMPPGISTILGAPLVFLAAQLLLGRAPWLPQARWCRAMYRRTPSSAACPHVCSRRSSRG